MLLLLLIPLVVIAGIGIALVKAHHWRRSTRIVVFLTCAIACLVGDQVAFTKLLVYRRRQDLLTRCETQMRIIHACIKDYQLSNGDFPPDLSFLNDGKYGKASQKHLCPYRIAMLGCKKVYGAEKDLQHVPMAELGSVMARVTPEERATLPPDYVYHRPMDALHDNAVLIEEKAYNHPLGFSKRPRYRNLLLVNGATRRERLDAP